MRNLAVINMSCAEEEIWTSETGSDKTTPHLSGFVHPVVNLDFRDRK
jgi:hypothetical protein